ncbi:1-acyl-sn-glycerol-3-phosphate acyltransferase [Paracrocinitomix mangrovi]|uniref:1-acyl-sn-glycerol-3-phosphate acyltransferase n=1 Tax=Paracrocinitomix mangrovi TaxID=2862509 RepID=UPI001C8E7A1D|nr:1-acyl-sn-glycerol-3-phosphate acyltransferase [Paracrocinitomix mangrovi]UKN02124.1 1-acyl-sn-glycerol-3-phosphate acyltransferase [Paracrocinitomix mangrovi]
MSDEKKEDKFIDVEHLIGSKNPKALKWTPKFLINYLKRKIHQDDVNSFILDHKGVNGYEFSVDVINKFKVKVEVEGLENLPKEGGVIVTLNHPLGGMDAMALITEVYPYRKDFKFVVNDLLMHLENLRDLFVGVNKHGTNTKEALEDVDKLYASDQMVFVFPAGLVSRKKKGIVKDLEWKKTFVTRARKYQKDVIPVHIDGELTKFFYRLSNFRSKIGVKANIEMLYLVDELFKQENKTITLRFGEPIPYTTFDKSKKDIEWAQWVKSKVYNLKKD